MEGYDFKTIEKLWIQLNAEGRRMAGEYMEYLVSSGICTKEDDPSGKFHRNSGVH